MSGQFAKVGADQIRWMLRNVKYDTCPPDAVCVLEMGGALVIGDLPSMTQREWERRWKCGRAKVRRIAGLVLDQYQTTNEHYRTTLRECFPHLTKRNEPAMTRSEPTRALFLKEEEREVDGSEPSAPSASLPEGSSSVETLRTAGSPDSVIRIWGEVTQAYGYIGSTITNRKHVAALGAVRQQAGPVGLRAAVVAYCEVVKAGTHPWQRDHVPSSGVFVKELPKWVAAGQTPAADTATRTRALELVDSIKGRIQAHGGSWKAATADLDGDDLELFARVVCVAGGADAAWQAWPRLGGMRDWDFGRAIDKARDSAGRM